MRQARILISGANGLLGQTLTERLHERSRFELFTTGRDPDGFHPAGLPYATMDIRDTGRVQELLAAFEPDVFVNCAAITQVDRCEEERAACRAINAEAPGQIAALCHRTGTHLVHVSTDFVFNGLDGPYVEGDPPDPVNHYGRSKLAGEQSIEESPLQQWSIVRTVLVYGWARRLNRSNIALWLIEELSDGRAVQIVTDQWRTPTYAVDLAAGIEQVIDRQAFGIYHLSGPDLVSVFEFARLLARCFGYDTSLVQPTTSAALDQRAPRPPKTGFIIEKARSELGFQPHSIESALQDLGTILDLPTAAD